MDTNPFEFSPPLRSADGRWAALASCGVATVLTTSSMFMPWLDFGRPIHYYGVDWTLGRDTAATCWFFSVFLVAGLCLAMIAGRRRAYLPVAAPLTLGVVSVVGAVGMLLVLRQASHISTLSHELYVDQDNDGPIHIAQAAWNGLAGFVIATIASARLGRLARRQAQQSRTALALINAELAVAAGDIIVEDGLVELVPTV